ncbi:hypothetical protein U9M48_016607 [Paspalum notatum var. saurae]|uniref:Rapid alkalinization factor 1 n=1 Tax=Paspalum notatum var. saurae TaxID=547442 RepID=A0AAQ3T7S8_PASNO
MRPSRAVLAATVAAVLLLLVAAAAGQVTTAVDPDGGWDYSQRVGVVPACTGTVEECGGGGSGTARRELAYGGYISYDAMSRGRAAPVYHDHWAADDDDADYGYGGVACTGGTVGDCAAPSRATTRRRELGGGGTIAYSALQKDRTPCSYRGASYYNCGPSGAANPYSRGCSAITQCRG